MPQGSPLTDLRHAGFSDVGRVREVNEDAYAAEEVGSGQLFVVADGMGGHESGDVASRIAVQTTIESFRNGHAIDTSQRLVDALSAAHQSIVARQGQRKGRERMGTTAVALHVVPGQAHYAWVGDSRIYLVRDGELSAITRDHTLGRELLERGYQDAEQVRSNPERDKLARALGMRDQWHPETAPPLPLEPGDMFLMCTDGLYRRVTESDMVSVLLGQEPVEAAIQLVQMANDGGGEDNITVQVIHVDTREAAVEAAARGGHIGSLTTELLALTDTEDTGGIELPQAPATQQLGPAPAPPSAPPSPQPPGPTLAPPATPPPPQQLGPAVEAPPAPRAGPAPGEPDEDPTPVMMAALPESGAPLLSSIPASAVAPPPDATPPVALESTDAIEPARSVGVPAPPAPSRAAAETQVVPEDRADTLPPPGAEVPQDPSSSLEEEASTEASTEVSVEVPPRRGVVPISRALLIVGALGLFLLAFLGGIGVTVIGVVLYGRTAGLHAGGDEADEVPSLPTATDDGPASSLLGAQQILMLPDDRNCEEQWRLLREHHDALVAEPGTYGDLSVRIFRCYDTEAYRAVEACAVRRDETKLREAQQAIKAARRFLDPTARADRKLQRAAEAVVARLGEAEVSERLAELQVWEDQIQDEDR